MENNGTRAEFSRRVAVGGAVLLAVGILLDLYGLPSLGVRHTFTADCQGPPQATSILSEKQLAQLLTIPEGASKQRLQEVVPTPYCRLSDLQIRAGAIAQREAYRLSFDRDTWLVVLYEGEQYTGYRFAK